MYEYIGNMHIHSLYSDGSLGIKKIAEAAGRSGLNFIIVTDHGNLGAYFNNEEGYYCNVLVLVGMEANAVKNHYLCLDVKANIINNDENPQEVIDQVNQHHGIGIIAHPYDKGSPLDNDSISFKWLDWEVENFQGIEIWNFTSQWKENLNNIFKALLYIIYPHSAIKGPCPSALQKLDYYQKQGKHIIAAGGSDAHGQIRKIGFMSLVLSDYDYLFRCISLHLLTDCPLNGELGADKPNIYEALRKGCFWTSYDYFLNSRGFRFIINNQEQSWQMGDTVPWSHNTAAQVTTPYPSKVKLLKDGTIFQTSTGRYHSFPDLKPGVYRVEAEHRHFLGYRPWIFSNSIWVE